MCGRYVSTKSTGDLLAEFDAIDAIGGETIQPDYNVAPTVNVRTVVNRPPREQNRPPREQNGPPRELNRPPGEQLVEDTTAGQSKPAPVRQLRLAHWGLVPSWAKDKSIGNKLINARAETIAGKPAFKRAFAMRRCLVPSDGWYEWMRDVDAAGKPRKQPYLMTPTDGHCLAFAGLYEFWKPQDAGDDTDLLLSVTVLTVPAQGDLQEIHDRMPLVLSSADWTRWLDPAVAAPTDLLQPQDEVVREALELRPVSTNVNSVKNNSPDLLQRVDPPVLPRELF